MDDDACPHGPEWAQVVVVDVRIGGLGPAIELVYVPVEEAGGVGDSTIGVEQNESLGEGSPGAGDAGGEAHHLAGPPSAGDTDDVHTAAGVALQFCRRGILRVVVDDEHDLERV